MDSSPHTHHLTLTLTIDAFSHRHSPHSISESIKSARKEPNPSPMPCAQTRSVSSSSSPSHSPSHPHPHHRRLLTQTLTTLDLSSNQIGEKGAQSIADALRTNTVSLFLLLTHSPSHPHSPSTPSHTDTHHTHLSYNQIGEKGAQSIADALRRQTGSVSSSSSHTHHLTLTHHRRLLTQTLTTLNLQYNQIGEKGAQSIADALRTNTVSLFLLLTHSPSHPHPHHRRLLTQTLTTLNLQYNQIGEKGAQSIADALRTNTVSLFLLLTHSPHSPSLTIDAFSHRHSPHSISPLNQIGDKGAQSIADALRTNTVSLFLLLTHSPSHPHSPSTPSHTDTHHTHLSNNQIGEKGAQSIADALRTNTVSLFLLLTHSPSHPHSPSTPSHTDTHHTRSPRQSNRR